LVIALVVELASVSAHHAGPAPAFGSCQVSNFRFDLVEIFGHRKRPASIACQLETTYHPSNSHSLVATVAGICGFIAASNGWIWMVEPWASQISPDRHILFLTDLWAHNASYGAGFVGGLVMMALIWRGRRVAGSGPSPTQQRQQQAEQDTSDD
jgi:hypothetical protein